VDKTMGMIAIMITGIIILIIGVIEFRELSTRGSFLEATVSLIFGNFDDSSIGKILIGFILMLVGALGLILDWGI